MIFKITENKNFKHYWLVLQGKEIFYYKNSSKEKVNGMHNLVGSYIKEGPEVVINDYRFFSFTIIFPTKQRNYYVQDKGQYDEWIKCFKKAIGYYNFFDFYVMKEDIGIGKFGLVKLGIHKLTNQKVAIKTIKKSSMTQLDLELVKSEIDIMKLLKHPNVVRLLDHFENAEYVYIVMELFQGGDLANFISKNHSKLSEEKFSNIMYQIASGLQYLHQFGILHRDLKPENIMLADKSNNTVIKIMDFGLSKVLGPKERVADGYGTLAFVAPEVLLRNPYNKQIDIWSLGIMMYYGLSGNLPFDDESNVESKIAKNIVYNELKFPSNKWSGRSKEVIDLIKKCLIKEQEKRIKLNEFLEHDWIKKMNITQDMKTTARLLISNILRLNMIKRKKDKNKLPLFLNHILIIRAIVVKFTKEYKISKTQFLPSDEILVQLQRKLETDVKYIKNHEKSMNNIKKLTKVIAEDEKKILNALQNLKEKQDEISNFLVKYNNEIAQPKIFK